MAKAIVHGQNDQRASKVDLVNQTGISPTLDTLFQRTLARKPDALALVDAIRLELMRLTEQDETIERVVEDYCWGV